MGRRSSSTAASPRTACTDLWPAEARADRKTHWHCPMQRTGALVWGIRGVCWN